VLLIVGGVAERHEDGHQDVPVPLNTSSKGTYTGQKVDLFGRDISLSEDEVCFGSAWVGRSRAQAEAWATRATCAAECAVGHDRTRDALLEHGANHRRMQALSDVAVLAVSRVEPRCKSVHTPPAAK